MVGNRVFGQSLIVCVTIALLLTPWGSLESKPTDVLEPAKSVAAPPAAKASIRYTRLPAIKAEPSAPIRSLIYGWQGQVAIGTVNIPYWMIVVSLLLGSLTAVSNSLRWTSLPSVITFGCFGLAAACSLVAIIDFAYHGAVGAGPVLAIVCALTGLAISPADEAARPLVTHRMSQERQRRQFRSAA